jgi:putative copper export protein
MIRTIENLVSIILTHTMSLLNKTAEKTIEACSTITSKVIAGLLGIALIGASGIGHAAGRAGAPWVTQAAEIIQEQIAKVTE